MKKLFNYASVLWASIIILGLGSCLSDNDFNPIDLYIGEGISISLRMNESVFETRNVGGGFASGFPAAFNTGHLYLVTPDGVIMEHFIIVNDGTGTLNANREVTNDRINRNELSHPQGVTIANLPPNLRGGRAVIVGNTSIANNAININNIKATEIEIRGQHNIGNANLFGYETLTRRIGEYAANGNRIYETHVLLSPTIARLQISNIVGMGNIESFEVEGVFIDNYYRYAQIDGTPVTASLRNNIAAGRAFGRDTSGYPFAFHTITFDWYRDHIASPLVWGSTTAPIIINNNNFGNFPMVRPARTGLSGDLFWEYNLFAGVETTAPRIVFRLRNIVRTDGVPVVGTRFVTFCHFVWYNPNDPTHGTNFPGISAGNIYNIPLNGLVFNEHCLTLTPEVPPVPSIATLSTRAIPIEIISN